MSNLGLVPSGTIIVSRGTRSIGNTAIGYRFDVSKDEVLKLDGMQSSGYIILHQKHRGDDKCFQHQTIDIV